MNIQNLQLIDRNETSTTILRLLYKSREVSNETNLESFKTFLLSKGFPIEKENFIKLFKELEEQKIGYFANNNKFVWKYSLKDVSDQILHPNKKVDLKGATEQEREEEMLQPSRKRYEPGKRIGRPKGSKNKPKDPQREGVFVFVTGRGQMISLTAADVVKLTRQFELLRNQFST